MERKKGVTTPDTSVAADAERSPGTDKSSITQGNGNGKNKQMAVELRKANTAGFRVLPSYYEAIRGLPDDDRLKMYDAIADFGFGNEVSELPPILQGYLNLIIPTLARSIKFEEKPWEI